MSNRHKIFLALFFVICAASGYAVYWWHETSLDHIAASNRSYRGPTLDNVEKALREKRPADARAIIDRLPEFEKTGIMKVLSRSETAAVRMFAVRYMRTMRDAPAIRAELARMVAGEKDETVSKLAVKALEGKR